MNKLQLPLVNMCFWYMVKNKKREKNVRNGGTRNSEKYKMKMRQK